MASFSITCFNFKRDSFCLLLSLFSLLLYGQGSNIINIKTKILESDPSSLERFNFIMELSEMYRPYDKKLEKEGLPADHLQLAKEAISWAEINGSKKQLAKANRFLVDFYCYSNNILDFVEIANEMVSNDNFASLQDKHFIYLKLSEAYKETGFVKEYIELTPTLYTIGRQLELASTHTHEEFNHMAMAYYKIKDYYQARFYFRKSLNYLRKTNRPFALASILNNIGLSFSKEEKSDSAKFYFKESLKVLEIASAEKEGFGTDAYDYKDHFKNVLKANIAYLDLDQADQAITAIYNELESAKIVKEIITEIQAYHKLAFLFYKKKDYDKALNYIKLAQNKMRDGTDNSLRLTNWDLKAKVLLALGRQNESDALFIQKNKLQDSIASVETNRTAQVASVLYEVKKKDLEIKNQQASIALLASENKSKRQLLIIGTVALLSIFSIIVLFRSRNAARKRQKLQEDFTQDLINAQESERSRLALDLHDSVGQQLMMLARKSKNTGDLVMEEITASTLANLRSISRNLHPSTIEQLGFTQAVEDLINRLDDETDILFTVEIDTIDDQLQKNEALHLYRIIQEILSNMIKHAQAKSAEVSLKKTKNNLKLVVKDAGIGFDLNQILKTSKSLGMKSLEERCKILNARLTIISKPNLGTKISVVIPV